MSIRTLTLGSATLVACASSGGLIRPGAPRGEVFAFESDAGGFNTRTWFYDDGQELVAFDAQFTPELARQAIAFARARTAHPIRTLVITHPNPDKFNGMGE
jgi:glyoxylase-like metal-dependent hydrolase (beta-lactamase superfamily II)